MRRLTPNTLARCLRTVCAAVLGAVAWAAHAQPTEPAAQPPSSIWHDELGQGFSRGTWQTGISFGAGVGNAKFGSVVAHDLALGSLNAGMMLTDPLAPGKWYSGNWEFLGELYAGTQIHPETRYITGLTPLLRYNFITGTRWVPFFTGGAGVTLTDIGGPDLGSVFQFDPQAGIGTDYFIRQNTALTFEYRWLHVSNAGIQRPNLGVNTQMFTVGIAWFF